MSSDSNGTIHAVGPDQPHATISEVADRLLPGDVVEVRGPIQDVIALNCSGAPGQPIIVRGVGPEPVQVDFGGVQRGVALDADHYLFENLEFTGATGEGWGQGMRLRGHDITVRSCIFRDNHNGITSPDSAQVGDLTIEYCEFDRNGYDIHAHQIYIASWRARATATIRFCYFHDGTGGANLKSRFPRNVIEYNWFESAGAKPLDLIDADKGPRVGEESILVGNVIIGQDRGNRYQFVHIGSDMARAQGNNARFIFVNNLFVAVSDRTRLIDALGIVKEAALYNNIFMRADGEQFGAVVGVGGSSSIRTRLGKVTGQNNWVQGDAPELKTEGELPPIESDFQQTLRGDDPGLVDSAAHDYRPAPDSPCRNAGTLDAPHLPEFEPPVRRRIAQGTEKRRAPGDTIDLGPFESDAP